MRKVCLLIFLFCAATGSYSQVIFSNPITGPNPNTSNPYTVGQTVDGNLTVSGIGRGPGISGANANDRYAASGWSTSTDPDPGDYFEFTLTPASGYEVNFSSFVYTGQASGTGPTNFVIRSSIDGFTNDIGFPLATGTTIDLSGAIFQEVTSAISFRLYGWGGTGATGTFSINQFSFSGSVNLSNSTPAPIILIQSGLSPFLSITGQPSNEQSYIISGTDLTGDILVDAPSGYEISLNNTTSFGSSIQLSHSGGSVASTTIYIRQNSTVPGLTSGNVSHSSANAVTQQLEVSGKVIAPEPQIPAAVGFANVTAHSFDINFTGGDGNGRIVVMRAGASVSSSPADGITYPANSQFGLGTALAPGEFIVYNGNGQTVQVNGLNAATTYYVSVFEFNDGGVEVAVNYLPVAGTGSHLTGTAADGLQLTETGIPFTIDFDQMPEQIGNGQWAGNGFAPLPGAGQLNSGAWAVAGWSEGALAFNETRNSGDFARGFTLTHPSSGGMYAFAPLAPGNRALGLQPGGADWAPGTLTLKVQNQSGALLHSLAIAYKLFVYNDQNRSSSFNLSYSFDDISYIPVASVDYASPEAVEVSPVWMQNDRQAEITGLAIANGQYVYLRWTSNDVSGSGSRDEFALDDITLVGNPVAAGPLPARFTTVKAIQKDAGVQIDFSNLTEENLVRYDVERSDNGRAFFIVSSFAPTWNHGEIASYRVFDPSPFEGNNFYRVRSVESNGNIAYSPVVRINLKNFITDLVVYPNPVKNDELGLQITHLPAGNYRIRVFNASGQTVLERTVNHSGGSATETIPIDGLIPGGYVLQVSGALTLRKRFIRQ